MFLLFSKLFHVRPVSQGDVYRADAKDIPRIFQVLTLINHQFTQFFIKTCLSKMDMYYV